MVYMNVYIYLYTNNNKLRGVVMYKQLKELGINIGIQ